MKNKKAIIGFILLLVGATVLHVLNGFVCSGWANQRIAFLLEIQIIAMMYYFYKHGKEFFKFSREHCRSVIGGCVIEGLVLLIGLREFVRTSGTVRSYIVWIFLLLLLAIYWLYILLIIHRCSLWKVYMVVGLLAGCAYMLLLPVYVAPDEPAHLWKAYAISEHIMGHAITDENGYVYGRKDDVDFTVLSTDYDTVQYTRYVESFDEELVSSELVSSSFYCLPGHDYQYMAQAMGITIGRILGWNAASTLLMGRFCGLLLFVVCTSFAISRLPFGSTLLFGVGLFPMTLQQAMSYSYDSFFMGVMFVLSALVLKRFYTKEKKLSIVEYIVLMLCMLFVLPMKSYAYFAISLLPIGLLLVEWLRKRGVNIKRVLCFMVGIMVVLLGLLFVLGRVGHLPGFLNHLFYAERIIDYAGEPGYNVGFFIDHPARLYNVFMDTLNAMGGFYISSTIGRKLGWFELSYPTWIYCGWVIFVFLLFITHEKKRMSVDKTDYVIGYLGVMVSVLCIMAGMLLHWTPVSTFTIQGVQGRYFIPLIPLTFFVLRQKIYNTQLEERHTGKVLLMGMLLMAFTIESIFDCMWM